MCFTHNISKNWTVTKSSKKFVFVFVPVYFLTLIHLAHSAINRASTALNLNLSWLFILLTYHLSCYQNICSTSLSSVTDYKLYLNLLMWNTVNDEMRCVAQVIPGCILLMLLIAFQLEEKEQLHMICFPVVPQVFTSLSVVGLQTVNNQNKLYC